MSSIRTQTIYINDAQFGITGGQLYINGVLSAGGITQGQLDSVSGWASGQIASTGQQAWLTANNNAINLSGNLTNTGVALINRDFLISGILSSGLASTGSTLNGQINSLSGFTLNASGALQAQIAGSAAGVTALNGLSGSLSIIGTGLITTSTGLGKIIISGDNSISGALTQTGLQIGIASGTLNTALGLTGQNLYNYIVATSGAIGITGTALYNIIIGLSGQANNNYASTGNLLSTGQVLYSYILGTSGAIGTTGTTLYNLVTALSGQINNNFATTGNLLTTGQTLYNYITQTSGTIAATGGVLYNDIIGLSGYTNNLFVQTGTILSYLTGIVTGFDTGWLSYNGYTFSSIPRVYATMELSGANNLYGFAISGRSTSGFYISYTDIIAESGVFLDVLAKI